MIPAMMVVMAATFTRPGSGRLMMFSCTRANTSVAETTLPTPTTAAMMMQGKIPLLKPSETISPKPLTPPRDLQKNRRDSTHPAVRPYSSSTPKPLMRTKVTTMGSREIQKPGARCSSSFSSKMPPWTW